MAAPTQLLIDIIGDVRSEFSVQDFLQPLQETAERVSQQVEEFASRLHRFRADRAADDEGLWTDAWGLLDDYRALAMKRLTRTTARGSRAFSHRKSTGDSDAQTQKLQLEADVWALTKNLLLSYSPRANSEAADAAAHTFSGLHRYSTSHQIWNAFLDCDTTAQVYETILAWLHERAEETSPSINDLVHNLTIAAERGEGSWSAGPLFTKAAIKKQKRDRAWPLPLDPSNPGLNSSLRRQSDGKPLVTQLDPDGMTREDAHLEVQDEFYEQAAWLTCWEMLRRGKTLSDFRSWWDEHNEQWRSLLLRCGAPGEGATSPWLRIMNLASNSDWGARCSELAASDAVKDPFQQAVYAVIAGNASVSEKVCETTDEWLFSELNALLIHRYRQYLQAYQKKESGFNQQAYQVPASGNEATRLLTQDLQANPAFKDELHEPHKLTQLALVGQDFDDFFVVIGRAAAQIAYADGGFGFKQLIARDEGPLVSESALLTAQDEDCVRVVVHLQLILQALGLLKKCWATNRYQLENNVVNYIGWLHRDKKWSLLPIYASKLSPERIQQVLGQILIDVTNDKERDAQVRLLKKYDIDVSKVVYGIASLATYHAMNRFKSPKFRFRAPRITERVGPGNTGQTKIRSAFMGENDAPSEEERLVSSVEWYRFVEAEKWSFACHHISFMYKLWLFEGRFEALRELMMRCSLAQISLSALNMNLQYADEFQDDLDVEDIDVNGAEGTSAQKRSPKKRKTPLHPLAREGTTRNQLYEKSLSWLQLEQLTRALVALERWQDLAEEVEEYVNSISTSLLRQLTIHRNRHDQARLRTFKRELSNMLDETMRDVDPIFDDDFLCRPQDTTEDIMFRQIRNHYLPECVLAYNAVLYFAGHGLSRTWLVQCMELAQRVAKSSNITDAFVEGGRMRELVHAFAMDSQALLLANEQGKNRGKSSKKERGIEMWQVQWKEDHNELDLDALD